MEKSNRTAGVLLFFGSFQFIIIMTICEALYVNYSISDNYISDLGVGKTAVLFNSSLMLLGLLIMSSAYLIFRSTNKVFPVLLLITGFAALGTGMFSEEAGLIHTIFSALTFIFSALTAFSSYAFIKKPFFYFGIAIGIIISMAIILFITGNFLGLGKGGMERLIVYPALLLSVGLGSYLIKDD